MKKRHSLTVLTDEKRMELERLLLQVAVQNSVSMRQVLSKSKFPSFVRARRQFAREARERKFTFVVIAHILGRHYSSVMDLLKPR